MRLPGRVCAFGLVLVVGACVGATSPTETTATKAPPSGAGTNSEAPPTVARTLADPPRRCVGAAHRLHRVSPFYGPVWGRSPVYGGFYARFDAGAGTFAEADAPRTRFGWRIKVLWLVDPAHRDPVTLRGENTSTREPLWFQLSDERTPSSAVVLDPAHPAIAHERGHWKEFSSYLYLPRAGCYRLSAETAGETWTLVFGFGR